MYMYMPSHDSSQAEAENCTRMDYKESVARGKTYM